VTIRGYSVYCYGPVHYELLAHELPSRKLAIALLQKGIGSVKRDRMTQFKLKHDPHRGHGMSKLDPVGAHAAWARYINHDFLIMIPNGAVLAGNEQLTAAMQMAKMKRCGF